MEDQALVVADSSGVIRPWTEAATTMLGHKTADAVGSTLDLIAPEPPT